MWLPWKKKNDPDAVIQLGSLESRVVELLWQRGEASVRDIHARIPELAYTTLMTTLDRLYKKRVLERRQDARAFVYRPRLSREDYHARLAGQLLRIAATDHDRDVVVASFVERISETDLRLLDELERLVKEKRRRLRKGA
jgi:predicted transcriptional regulator